eukprot:95646_1
MDREHEALVQMEETIQSTFNTTTRNDHDHENEAKQEDPSWLIGIYERLKGTDLKEIEVIMKENQFQTEYELMGYLSDKKRTIWRELQPADDTPVDEEKLDRIFWYITNDARHTIPESTITHMRQKISEWNHGEFCKVLDESQFADIATPSDDADLYKFVQEVLYDAYLYSNTFHGPLTKGKEYANSAQQKTRIILRNVDANQGYIPLERGGVYEYEFDINASNDDELDMDVGWALMRKIQNTNEYAVAEEWTWNVFRGTTTHKEYRHEDGKMDAEEEEKSERKDEEMVREIECKGTPNKPDAWKDGERVVVRCDLKKGRIEVVNIKEIMSCELHTVFQVADDIFQFDGDDPTICPVVYAVRPQSIATKNTLFEYWTNQTKQQIETIDHPIAMWSVDLKRIEDDDDEKKAEEKRKQIIIDINNIVTRNNDKYFYLVEIKQDYVDCDIGWILMEKSEDEKEKYVSTQRLWTYNTSNLKKGSRVDCCVDIERQRIHFIVNKTFHVAVFEVAEDKPILWPVFRCESEKEVHSVIKVLDEREPRNGFNPLPLSWVEREDAVEWEVHHPLQMYMEPAQLTERVKDLIRLWNRTGTDHSEQTIFVLDLIIQTANSNPFLTAIKLAIFLHSFSRYFPIIEDEINVLAIHCEEKAIQILNDLRSNRLKLILLSTGNALALIIENELKVVTQDNTMQVLRHCLWVHGTSTIIHTPEIELIQKVPSELQTWGNQIFLNYYYSWAHLDYFKTHYFRLKHQYGYFYSPLGILQLEFIIYMAYLLLMVFASMSIPDVYQPSMHTREIVFWIISGLFICAEFVQIMKHGRKYFQQQTNYSDIVTGIVCIILFVLRMLVVNGKIECVDNEDDVDECFTDDFYQILYMNLWFILLISSSFRMVVLCSIFESMAFLLSNIKRMMYDMLNVFVFIFIFVVGFAAALLMSTGGEIEGYSSLIISLRSTLYGFIDGMDWTEFNELNGDRRAFFIQLWIFCFVIFAVLILLNLIIAIMSSTYEKVNESAEMNVRFDRWRICFNKTISFAVLPPPAEFIISLMGALIRSILYCAGRDESGLASLIYYPYKQPHWWKCQKCGAMTDEGFPKCYRCDEPKPKPPKYQELKTPWICGHCAHTNTVNVTNINNLDDQKGVAGAFTFDNEEKQTINVLDLPLCLNCYQPKNEATTQNIIESVLSFYLYIGINSVSRLITFVFHLSVFLVMGTVFLVMVIPFWCSYCFGKRLPRYERCISDNCFWATKFESFFDGGTSRIKYDTKIMKPEELDDDDVQEIKKR